METRTTEEILKEKERLELIILIRRKEGLEEAIEEVLEVLNGDGSPNLNWIQQRLLKSIQES